MQASEALKVINKRLLAAGCSNKATELARRLEPVLEALVPSKATRLDIRLTLAEPGDDVEAYEENYADFR